MPPNIILFAGAPSPSIPLDACTLTTFSSPFCHLLHIANDQASTSRPPPNAPTPATPIHAVAWRSLPATRQPLHTGLTQALDIHAHDAAFFTTAHVTALSSLDSLTHPPGGHGDGDGDGDGDDSQDLLSRFYEESFAAHRSLLADDTHDDSLATLTLSSADINQTTCPLPTNASAAAPAEPGSSPPLCDLRDIPPAPHIAAQSPATMSRNLLVAVLSVAPPRAVTTRWGAPFSLVEVLVGDDTRSGFAITFWVPGNGQRSGSGTGDGGVVQAVPVPFLVQSLRRQDVVLMRNVALQVFRGKVYGQSLPRGLTRLELLWRRAGGGLYAARDLGARAAAAGGQRAKAGRVKDWVVRFVGGDAGAGAGASTRRTRSQIKSWDRPPDDSQG